MHYLVHQIQGCNSELIFTMILLIFSEIELEDTCTQHQIMYGPDNMDQILWTRYCGPDNMDQILWTRYCGPDNMDQILWTR